MFRRLLLPLLSLLFAAPAATAHDLYFEARDGRLVLQHGHLEATEEHGHAAAACPDGILTGAVWIDADGTRREAAAPLQNGWPATSRAVLVEVSTGCWTKTAQGTQNRAPDEVGQALTSWRSFESAKRLAAWDEALAGPLGTGDGPGALELVPLEDPFGLKVGDKLTVRLVHGGRPIADAVVTYGGKARGKTDADGRINIRLKEPGTQALVASWIRPDPDGRCERIVTTTTLQFELEAR